MRNAVVLATLLTLVAGCESTPRSTPDPVLAQLKAQSDEIKALREQIASLQKPVPIESQSAQASPRYRMTVGKDAVVKPLDVVYITELTSGRTVALTYNAGNEKVALLAGRDMWKDFYATQSSRPQPPPKPITLEGGSSFVTIRGATDEDVFLIIDDTTQKLLIYDLDVSRKRLELVGAQELQRLFSIKP